MGVFLPHKSLHLNVLFFLPLCSELGVLTTPSQLSSSKHCQPWVAPGGHREVLEGRGGALRRVRRAGNPPISPSTSPSWPRNTLQTFSRTNTPAPQACCESDSRLITEAGLPMPPGEWHFAQNQQQVPSSGNQEHPIWEANAHILAEMGAQKTMAFDTKKKWYLHHKKPERKASFAIKRNRTYERMCATLIRPHSLAAAVCMGGAGRDPQVGCGWVGWLALGTCPQQQGTRPEPAPPSLLLLKCVEAATAV